MKIPIGLLGRLALPLIALTLMSHHYSYRSFEELLASAIHQQEADKVSTLSRIIVPQIERDVQWVRSVARLAHDDIVAILDGPEKERQAALAARVEQAYRDSGVDILEVTDEQGAILFRAQEPLRKGDQATTWGIEEALAGTAHTSSEKTSRGASILYIEPLRSDNRILGSIISGRQINETFLNHLSAETGAELALVSRTGAVIAATSKSPIVPDPSAIDDAFQEKIASFRIDHEHHATLYYLPVMIVDDGWVIIAQIDSLPALTLLSNSNRQAALRSATLIGIAILITLFILHLALRPLRRLRQRGEAIVHEQTGKLPKKGSGNDLRDLADTLNELTDVLLQRNQTLLQQQADQHLSAAAFESQQAMLITDAQTKVLRANQAFTRITGFTTEEIVGKPACIFKPESHTEAINQAIWNSLSANGQWHGEVAGRRKNGEIYPRWVSIAAVKNPEGILSHYIVTYTDISGQKMAADRIHQLSFFDPLTRLPNRSLMMDRLRQTMTLGKRNGNLGALLLINLDNFKTLNDTQGHDSGDLLLQLAGKRITGSVRASDTVARPGANTIARIGGDEFAVILGGLDSNHETAIRQAETVCEKIQHSLNHPYQLGNSVFSCSASIGATLFGRDETAPEDLLVQADLAVDKAKNSGRNTLCFFDHEMQALLMERTRLEIDLRQALDSEQFRLVFQPQVVEDGTIIGAEVLIRWQHPERGMVSPATFIPLAESSGLILPLGHWVLQTACAQLAKWSADPRTAKLSLSVNVSATQFHHPGFVDQVLSSLRASGANSQRLKLELTESMLVENIDQLIEKMLTLQQSGVSFSLDDFGTGYSSLTYLKRLPLEQLKIDQSFVQDVLDDSSNAAIANTIIALGNSLGLQVIAEGVETEAQRKFLSNAGCLAYQGYFFSRPVPITDFERLLQEENLPL